MYRDLWISNGQVTTPDGMAMSTDEVHRTTPGPGLPGPDCGHTPQVGAAVPECWARSASDRERLGHACAVLRHHGIVAFPALGPPDAAVTRERIGAAMLADFPRWDGSYMFWTAAEDERCLSGLDALERPLLAHVGGPVIEVSVRAAMEMVGLTAAPGPVPGTLTVTGP